jgi:tRNA/rRNA methyltransferase
MSVVILLIAPQMGENIGAVARVMKNFGLSELRIVNPRDGWPNEKADAMSVGAIDIIQNAKIYDALEDAISDLEYIYAATGQERALNKSVISSDSLPSQIKGLSKCGIMFGRENNGLRNEEIAYANSIVSIKSNKEFSSLNIAHAVAVIAYEIRDIEENKIEVRSDNATQGELDYFVESLLSKIRTNGYFSVEEKYTKAAINIRNIFKRIPNLSKTEIKTLMGIVKKL